MAGRWKSGRGKWCKMGCWGCWGCGRGWGKESGGREGGGVKRGRSREGEGKKEEQVDGNPRKWMESIDK